MWTPVRTTWMPASARTVSNRAGNLPSRMRSGARLRRGRGSGGGRARSPRARTGGCRSGWGSGRSRRPAVIWRRNARSPGYCPDPSWVTGVATRTCWSRPGRPELHRSFDTPQRQADPRLLSTVVQAEHALVGAVWAPVTPRTTASTTAVCRTFTQSPPRPLRYDGRRTGHDALDVGVQVNVQPGTDDRAHGRLVIRPRHGCIRPLLGYVQHLL